jgi:biotin synthase
MRLPARLQRMSGAVRAMRFLADMNLIFRGEKLLTSSNPKVERDGALLAKLRIETRQ